MLNGKMSAWIYDETKQYKKLLDHCRTILKYDSISPYPWNWLSKVYSKIGLTHYSKAAEKIYKIKEKLKKKSYIKEYRKIRIRWFFKRKLFGFLQYFKRKYQYIRKSRENFEEIDNDNPFKKFFNS